MTRHLSLALLLLLAGCDDYQRTRARLDFEAEMRRPCRDKFEATANVIGERQCRPDQVLTFEKDADGDAYAVCRCVRKPSEP